MQFNELTGKKNYYVRWINERMNNGIKKQIYE